jgi:hypothetical protein
MAISVITQPNNYMAGYSAIPLRISDSGYTNSEQYKYITSILWDKVTVTGAISYNYNNNVYTVLTTSSAHNFKDGDSVLLNDENNNNLYTGYWIIVKIVSTTQVVINKIFDDPFGINDATLSRSIKYKMSPDPDGEAKLDLSNTIKDFVTENLEDVNEIFSGSDTAFKYDLMLGNESIFVWPFLDNLFATGSFAGYVGFSNTGFTSTSDVPFQVGDQINITQDLYAWPYTDNIFSAGNVGFTGTTNPFLQGQSILITGQITNPQYNIFTTVQSALTNSLITFIPYGVASPTEGGYIYGTPRPEYNGVATILDIYVDGILGLVIVTDKLFTTSSPAISGNIRYADDINTQYVNLTSITGKTAYNARISRLDYTVSAFDPYVIQNRSNSSNYISTILEHQNTNQKYRIEPSTKSWLLAHSVSGYTNAARYEWYNSNNSLLGFSYITNTTGNNLDFYFPIGLEQVAASVNRVDSVALSTISGSVDSYYVQVSQNSTGRTNSIFFELNDDCSMFDILHLMWKDAYGSWLSYPFIYLSRDSTEVERKTYYQREGNWDNNTFGYDSYGRGQKQYYNRSRDKYLLNSGFLYQYEVPLMKDLMESASVYLQLPDGKLIGCIIEENQIESKKLINDDLIQYTFNVRLANNEYRF